MQANKRTKLSSVQGENISEPTQPWLHQHFNCEVTVAVEPRDTPSAMGFIDRLDGEVKDDLPVGFFFSAAFLSRVSKTTRKKSICFLSISSGSLGWSNGSATALKTLGWRDRRRSPGWYNHVREPPPRKPCRKPLKAQLGLTRQSVGIFP